MPIGEGINGFFEGLDMADNRKMRRAAMQGEMATMPDRINAQTSGLQLQNARNQSELGLVGPRTDNTLKQLQLEGAGLDAAIQRQPNELQTQANTASINKILSENQVDNIPRVLAEHRAKNLLGDADLQVAGIVKLGELMRTRDKSAVIKFMNDMRQAIPGIGLKANVADVSVVDDQDPNSGGYVFNAHDVNGVPVFSITATQMQSAMDMIRPPGKEGMITVKPGHTLVKTGRGGATPIYTAPAGLDSVRQTTLERNLNMLTSSFGMNQREALAYLNTSKTMSREQFILKGMQDLIAIGNQPSQEDIERFGNLYDSTRGEQNSTSNSGQEGNLDPKIKELLGIP